MVARKEFVCFGRICISLVHMWQQEIPVFYLSFFLSTWATITKCHTLGGLNNRRLFVAVLEAGKFLIKVLAAWVLHENSLPGLHTAASHCVLTWGGGEGGKHALLLFLFLSRY